MLHGRFCECRTWITSLLVLKFQTLVAGLSSKDWVLVCEALNNTRRIAIYHREDMLDML